MAWGKAKATPPPPRSLLGYKVFPSFLPSNLALPACVRALVGPCANFPSRKPLSQLVPLVVVFALAAGAAWVGYQIYLSVTQIKGDVSEKMGKKNVVFTKDGLKVGVKHVQQEGEIDATQRYLVSAWNLSSNKAAADKKSK